MITKSEQAKLIAEWEQQLAELVEQRKQLLWLDNRMSTLRNLIANARALWDDDAIRQQKISMGLEGLQITKNMPPLQGGVRKQNMALVLEGIFKAYDKPLRVRDLLPLLRERGFTLIGKNPLSSIALAMSRKPEVFMKVGPNTFQLKESMNVKGA